MQTDNAVGVGVECGVCVCACACVVKVCNNTHTQASGSSGSASNVKAQTPPDGLLDEAKKVLLQHVFVIRDWHAPASRLVLVLVLVC